MERFNAIAEVAIGVTFAIIVGAMYMEALL